MHHLVFVVVVLLSNKSDKHHSDWCFLATIKLELTMAKDPQPNLFEGKNDIETRKKTLVILSKTRELVKIRT